MAALNVGWAVCFLPLAFIVLSYAVETRRAIAVTLTFGTVLVVVAALVLIGAELAQGRPTYQSTVPIFSYPVIQSPFNAATKTLVAATLQPSIGILVDPLSVVLALAVALSGLTAQLYLVSTTRAGGQTVMVHRAVSLAIAAALGLVLAPGYLQATAAAGLLALAAYLAAADDATTVGLRIAARRLFGLAWLGTLGLLLTAVFLYVKFSGQIEAAATSGPHPSTTYPDGFNFAALAARWLAAPHGTVTGVGPRTLVLAAVLELVAAGVLVAVVALAALSRRPAGAAGVATAWITTAGLGLGGVAVLARTAVLLEVATHVLPIACVVAALLACAAAAAAVRTAALEQRVLWLAASGLATAVVGVGLGSDAGAAALASTVVLAVPAVLGGLGLLVRRGGDPDAGLQALWRGGTGGRAVVLGALALAGPVGLGTFFARAAVLGAAFSARLPAGTAIDPAARVLTAIGVVGAGALAAAAVALALRPHPAVAVPARRSRRTPRVRDERSPRSLGPLVLGAAGLAAASGLAILPGVGASLGAFVVTPPGTAGLAANGWALGLTLLVPLVAAAAGWRGWGVPEGVPEGGAAAGAAQGPRGAGREGPAERPAPAAALLAGLAAAERLTLTGPGRAILAVDARLEALGLAAIGDGARALATWADGLLRVRRELAAAAAAAGVILTVAALAIWVGLQHVAAVHP